MGFLDDILGKKNLFKPGPSTGGVSGITSGIMDTGLPGIIGKEIAGLLGGAFSPDRDELQRLVREMVREEITHQLEPVMPLLRKMAEQPELIQNPVSAPEDGQSGPFVELADLVQSVRPSVVTVLADEGQGSGVFISDDGRIVTNRHVVGFSYQVAVRLSDSSEYPGKVIRSWPSYDLALIQLTEAVDIPVVPENEERIREGESVVAMGTPGGLANTVTQGVISSIQRIIGNRKYIQHSAAVNPGNSGGPLFNLHGRLIGINTLGRSESQGIFMAVPVTVLMQLMKGEDLDPELNYCAVCGNTSPKEEIFCLTCGYRVKGMNEVRRQKEENGVSGKNVPLECAACGFEHPEPVRYCARCGENMHRQYEEDE